MIDSQNIHDALNLLPDDLLAPVDALRRKKWFPWKTIASVAACLCLCVGLWFFFPGAAEKNAACDTEVANGTGLIGTHGFSCTGIPMNQELEVYSVGEDHITAVPVPSIELSDNICVQMTAVTVNFENLHVVPELKPGQHIRIYYDKMGQDGVSVSPYRIEIIKEAEK